MLIRTEFCRRRLPKFAVGEDHKITEAEWSLFAAVCRYNCLWSEVTMFNKSQIKAITGTDGQIKNSVAIYVGGDLGREQVHESFKLVVVTNLVHFRPQATVAASDRE